MAKHTVLILVVFLIACGFLVSTVVGARYRLPLRGSSARRNSEIRGVVSPSTKIKKYGAKLWFPSDANSYHSVVIVNYESADETGNESNSHDESVNSDTEDDEYLPSSMDENDSQEDSSMQSSSSDSADTTTSSVLVCDIKKTCPSEICTDDNEVEIPHCICSSKLQLASDSLGNHFCMDMTPSPSDSEEEDPLLDAEGKEQPKTYPGEQPVWSSV